MRWNNFNTVKKNVILFLFVGIMMIIVGLNSNLIKNVNALQNGSKDEFITTQSVIDSSRVTYQTTQKYVSISNFYNEATSQISGAPTSTQVISISNSRELYIFSYLCFNEPRFLTYDYELLSNIEYGLEEYFIPIGYMASSEATTPTSFSGSFNGNGFYISKLRYLVLNDEMFNTGIYATKKLTTYAMFAYNSGVIENFGLIEPELLQIYTIQGLEYISPLVGNNTGRISNIYLQDFRNPANDGGIYANDYMISGFVSLNSGIIENCYVAYSSILNYAIFNYISFVPITYNGTVNNCYFYDESIDSYDGETYSYNQYLGYRTNKNLIGTYARYSEDIRNAFLNVNGWYSKDSYNTNIFNDEFPIRKGLNEHPLEISDIELDIEVAFEINNIYDFAYVYQLANNNSYFFSNKVSYYINNDLDYNLLPSNLFTYSDFIDSRFVGVLDNRFAIALENGEISHCPTIYNPYIDNYIEYSGSLYYGMFPLFGGRIENLNIISKEMSYSFLSHSTNSPYKVIGVVCGLSENAFINNVNVYANINLNNNTFGNYYCGLLCGASGRESIISNITSAGSINGAVHQSISSLAKTGCVTGNSVGGVIGYTYSNNGSISDILSDVTITATSYNTSNNINQYIGGILGSGYLSSFKRIANHGNININSTYSNIYAAGVVGSVFGSSDIIEAIHNQGDISIVINEPKTITLSGVMNVDFVMVDTDTLTRSTLDTFYGAGISNGSNINITNNATITRSNVSSLNTTISGVLNINASREFKSELSGIYNLGYKYNGNNKLYITNDSIIDISLFDNYATCINSNANSENGAMKIDTVYNFRDVNFITTNDIYFNNVKYSGCILGKYYTLSSIYNEGNININISNNATNALSLGNNLYKKFIVVGVFEEVSSGHSADVIYNDGNIDFYLDQNVDEFYFNLYISGICYANRSQITNDSDYDKYRLENIKYDNSAIGSINQAINNGKINATSYAIEHAIYGSFEEKSANGQVIIGVNWYAAPFGSAALTFNENGNIISNINTSGLLKGMSNISGVCSINEYVITNTFNLGNIFNANYIVEAEGDYAYPYGFEVNSGGLTFANIGQYAQIKNSANNGIIKAVNFSSVSNSSSNAAGISVRNDILESGVNYTSGGFHSKQLICFTINYGEVFAYNYCKNVSSIEQEQHSKAAGIMALGLCSIINTVNYGNIYGSEISSGIFGLVYFEKVATEVNINNKVIFANSINYGNIWGINKGATSHLEQNQGNSTKDKQTYQELLDMSFANQDDFASIDTIGEAKDARIGALIGVSNLYNSDNAQYISIRYLINFCEAIPLVGGEYGISSAINPTVDTMVSTYSKIANGVTTYDKFMGKTVTYGPLSSEVAVINNIQYPGVFNRNFQFRLAVEGEIPPVEVTDNYITDFFGFVGFTKVNDSLLEKIGWRTIAYTTASMEFTKDLESLENLMSLYKDVNSSGYNQLVINALNTNTWIGNADPDVLPELVQSLLEGNNLDLLHQLLRYLFIESSNKNAITNEMRNLVINELLANLNTTLPNKDYLESLLFNDSSSFSSILAEVICTNDLEKEVIKNFISDKIRSLDNSQIESIARDYIQLLNNNTFDVYLNDSSIIDAKIKVLTILTNNVDDKILYDLFRRLEVVSTDDNIMITMKLAYEQLTEAERKELFIRVLANNTDIDNFNTVINAVSNRINYFEEINNVNNINYINENEFSNPNNYLEVWNLVRNNNNFKNYLESILPTIKDINGNNEKGIYGIATESRNTFQSLDKPAFDGRNVTTLDYNNNESLLFTYEKTISPNTYYYGPFRSINNARTVAYKFNDATYGVSLPGGYQYNATYTDIGNQSGGARYVPTFTTTDAQDIINVLGVNTPIAFYYDKNEQFVSESHFDAFSNNPSQGLLQDFSGTNLIAGHTFTLNGTTVTTREGDSITGYKGTTSSGQWTVTVNNVEYNITGTPVTYATFIKTHAIKYYMVSGHEIGIIRFYDPYSTYRASYFTAKSGTSGGIEGYVYTTQYIDYKAEDLVKLDGILTGYTETIVQSQEEIEIIEFVCNNYLFNNTNRSNTVKVIKKVLLESLQNKSTVVDNFFNEIIYNNTTLIDLQTMKDYLVVDNYNTSLTNYLMNNYQATNKNGVILLSATQLGNFKYTIDYLLNNSNGYYAYFNSNVFQEVSDSINNFEPQYIIDLINYTMNVNDLTFTEALNAVQSLTKSELETMFRKYPTFDALMTDIIISNGNAFTSRFTFSDTWGTTITPVTIDNVNYTFGALAKDASPNNNIITFRANSNGYLKIVSNNGNNITVNNNTGTLVSNSTYEWPISINTFYTIRCPQNAIIYNVYEGIITESLDATSRGTNITYDTPFRYVEGSDSVSYYITTGNNQTQYSQSYDGYLFVPAGGSLTFTTPQNNNSLAFVARSQSGTSQMTLASGSNTYNLAYLYKSGNRTYRGTLSGLSTTPTLVFYHGYLTNNATYTLTFSANTYLYAIGVGTRDSTTNYTWTQTVITSTTTNTKIFDQLLNNGIVSIAPFKTNRFITDDNYLYGEDLPIIRINSLSIGSKIVVSALGANSQITLENTNNSLGTINLTNASSNYSFNVLNSGDYELKISGFVKIENIDLIEFTSHNLSCQIEHYYSKLIDNFMNQDNFSNVLGKEAVKDYIFDNVISNANIHHLSINDLTESGNITNYIVNDIFTINASTNQNVTISTTNPKYLNFISSGSNSNRSIEFVTTSPSYVVIKASGNSLVLSNNNNQYIKPISINDNYHIYDANTNGVYYIYSNDNDCSLYDVYVIPKSIDANSLINTFNTLYPNFPTTTNSIAGLDGIDNILVEKYLAFKDTTRANEDFINDFINLILFFSPATFDYSNTNSLWNIFSEQDVEYLMNVFGLSFDSILESYIYDDNNYLSLERAIEILIRGDSRLINDVFTFLNLDINSLTEAQKATLSTIYVSTDYNVVMENAKSNQTITVEDTILYDIVMQLPSEYQYYYNGQLINDKFENTMHHIGYNLVTSGYGIYALASSKGYYNGAYIPDNITFNTVSYENDIAINYLTEINPYYELNSDNKYQLSKTRSGDWRSELVNGDEEYTNTSSVNYGFKVAMKQLKKSIATTIFDLVLVDNNGNNYILHTDTEYIKLDVDGDETKGSVTFYVPSNIGANILSSTFVVSSYEIADKATIDTTGKVFTVGNTNNTLRVVAEDITVIKDYDVYLIQTGAVSVNYDSYEVVTNAGLANGVITNNTILDSLKYKDSNMIINLSTQYIPQMTDLTKYLYLDDVLLSESGLVEFNSTPYVGENSSGNWLNGDIMTATLDMKISDSLTKGNHVLSIKYSESCKFDLSFTMDANPEKEIIKMVYDGKEVVFNNNEAITYIKYGKTFSQAQLSASNGIPSYLDSLIVSSLATVDAEASIIIDADVEQSISSGITQYKNGILTYKVVYSITPEDGSEANVYTHYLVEVDPFASAKDEAGQFIIDDSYNRNNYAYVYERGKAMNLVPLLDGTLNTEFRRGTNPKYYINYNLGNFYNESTIEDYLSIKAIYNNVEVNDINICQVNVKRSGIGADFYDRADIGDYTLLLEYATDAIGIVWNDQITYQRTYSFPEVHINKLASDDSYIKNIAFTREANKLSNLATLASLNMIYESSDDPNATNTYEYINNTLESSRDVVSNATYGIVYQTDAALNAREYYIVGSVSDAILEDYSPVFVTEEHAKIYRYKEYGNNRLLYVEFVDGSNNKVVYLVDEQFNNVYDEQDLTTPIATIVNNKFTYDSIEYTISDDSGKPTDNNKSLYCDYVGSPEAGQLWYNDYIIYSENYPNDNTQYRLYHIAVIDITNKIYFTIIINDATTNKVLANDYIYVRIKGFYQDDITNQLGDEIGEIGVFAYNTNEVTTDGSNIYQTKHSIQTLQYGYYYFNIDIPLGMEASYVVLDNKINNSNLNDNSYLPPASLVTQRITIEITIRDQLNVNVPWAEGIRSLIPQIVSETRGN